MYELGYAVEAMLNEGLELDVPYICTVECPRAVVIDSRRMD